jgi:hypothetical protein
LTPRPGESKLISALTLEAIADAVLAVGFAEPRLDAHGASRTHTWLV